MKKNIYTLILIIAFTQLATAQSQRKRDKGKAYVQLGFTILFYDEIQLKG